MPVKCVQAFQGFPASSIPSSKLHKAEYSASQWDLSMLQRCGEKGIPAPASRRHVRNTLLQTKGGHPGSEEIIRHCQLQNWGALGFPPTGGSY